MHPCKRTEGSLILVTFALVLGYNQCTNLLLFYYRYYHYRHPHLLFF